MVRRRSEKFCALALICITAVLTIATLPTASFDLDTGASIDFNKTEGKWLLIAYWATWCGPCREEIRILNSIHRQRDELNVIVLGVNFDGLQGEQLASDKARFNSKIPDLLSDPHKVWELPRPDFIPRILVVNPEGSIEAIVVGSTTRRNLISYLDH